MFPVGFTAVADQTGIVVCPPHSERLLILRLWLKDKDRIVCVGETAALSPFTRSLTGQLVSAQTTGYQPYLLL